MPGIFAIGDINTYPGKLKLILSRLPRGGARRPEGAPLRLSRQEAAVPVHDLLDQPAEEARRELRRALPSPANSGRKWRVATDEGLSARRPSFSAAPSFVALIRPDFVGPPSPALREKGVVARRRPPAIVALWRRRASSGGAQCHRRARRQGQAVSLSASRALTAALGHGAWPHVLFVRERGPKAAFVHQKDMDAKRRAGEAQSSRRDRSEAKERRSRLTAVRRRGRQRIAAGFMVTRPYLPKYAKRSAKARYLVKTGASP